jgi:hypothetical protein
VVFWGFSSFKMLMDENDTMQAGGKWGNLIYKVDIVGLAYSSPRQQTLISPKLNHI